ncbi:hypothetical protein ACVIW2_005058 [Bradyrhizobium huanghuaihaiense]
MLIPIADVELYILLGWSLTDEPTCSYARMTPPAPASHSARPAALSGPRRRAEAPT